MLVLELARTGCARSIAGAARAAAICSTATSFWPNVRGRSEPTCSTPIRSPSTISGHAEQRADPLLAQDRVEDVGVIDVGDEDRDALGRDPAGEAPADRDPHAALDLLLDPLGRARDELLRLLVEQQNRDRVDVRAPPGCGSAARRAASSSGSSDSAGSLKR